jgi:hypothetical protein
MSRLAVLIIAAFLAAGCAQTGGPGGFPPPSATGEVGSANFQRCVSQCDDPSNAGSGPLCRDGCRFQEAENTKDPSWCDRLDQKANRGECYGTVAKAAGDLKICDRLSGEERNECVASFGGPSTS